MEKYSTIPSSTPAEDGTSSKMFTGWIVLFQVLGLTAVVLVGVWMGHYNGGFAWQENPTIEFNYHPLFMIIGMIFLYGNAIISYRVFRNTKKIYVKLIHLSLNILALLFAAVGLKAVFDSHNLKPEGRVNNLYSLHSWLGIGTIVLFSLQWIGGFVSFLAPRLPLEARAAYKPVHVFWGLALFISATACCLTGITEKLIFKVEMYSARGEEGILANFLGVVLVALAVVVVYILTNAKYQRPNIPDDQIPLTE